MKKVLIVSSLTLVFLGVGGWIVFQKYLENEIKKADLESSNRRVELDKAKAMVAEQLKKEQPWEPLGSLSGDTADSILKGITSNYGFSRFIDTWGRGRALYIPTEAWNNLSVNQKSLLIDYSRRNGLNAINIGTLKSSNNIYIDSTVWQN